jgi:transposase
MRKVTTYSSSKKMEVIKDLLRGDKTFQQVCIKHGIAKSTVKGWQKQFEENGHMVFEISSKKIQEPNQSPEYLKSIIGNLTVENDILKKALSVWD